jgi:hypothetical protein
MAINGRKARGRGGAWPADESGEALGRATEDMKEWGDDGAASRHGTGREGEPAQREA